MKLTITNSTFEDQAFFNALNKVVENDKISIADAYRINKLVKDIQEKSKEYSEMKQQALEKYGEPDPEREGYYIINKDNQSAFTVEMEEVLKIEHDLGDKVQFPNSIKDGISVSDINLLDKIFDFSNLD